MRGQKSSLFGELLLPGLVLSVKVVRYLHWQGRLIVVSVIEACYLMDCPKLFCPSQNFVREQKSSLFGELLLTGLVLSVEIVRNMHGKGRLMVVSVVEAGYLTNCRFLFVEVKLDRNAPPVWITYAIRTCAEG